jgi:hypothetical protein
MECYAKNDYAQAIIAFREARCWDQNFRLAWLWESRSYQRAGFAAQARRVLEAGQLADQPVGQAIQRPVLAIVAGSGVTAGEQQEFTRRLADSGKVSVLDPRWIGASAREVDLQLTGEMAARSETHNAWLAVDQVVFLERTGEVLRIRKQDAVTGEVLLRTETSAANNGVAQLAQNFFQSDKTAGSTGPLTSTAQKTLPMHIHLPVNPAEAELARCIDRAMRNPADVRALLAAADACLPWETDELLHDGKRERGVEWRVRGEFLVQAVDVIRRNPGQKDASFWLASALWRQRYTPEYSVWALYPPNIPLQEQMKPLLDLFPQSADATNLSETVTENISHNRRPMPTDARYLQPPFPADTPSQTESAHGGGAANGEARLEKFRSLVAQNHLARASLLFTDLPRTEHVDDSVFYAETQAFMKLMLQDDQAHGAFMHDLSLADDSQRLAELMTEWKPSFGPENRREEIFALCDVVAKVSGVQAERRFLEEQFQRYLEDYGTLLSPTIFGLGYTLPVRIKSVADSLDAAGHFDDAESLYELIIRTPEVPSDMRHTTAYDLAVRYYNRADHFHATEFLRELLTDDTPVGTIRSPTDNSDNSNRDAAYELLKHIRLFDVGGLDFSRCCGEVQPPPAADSAEMEVLETLYKERMALIWSVGPPTAASLDKTHQEVIRLEKEMLEQHRAAMPAFLAHKIKESGPGTELLGLCAQLGTQAGPLLPQLVASVSSVNSISQYYALRSLANIGHPAAAALPMVIMAEESDNAQVQSTARYARGRLGVAPRQTVPYLARLIYHPNYNVAQHAADSLAAAASLPAEFRAGLSDEDFVQRIQNWWENTGSWQNWDKQ